VSVTPPSPESTPQIDVSCEELEELLEKVRSDLGEAGYQKTQAAIRTPGYVTELLRNQEATLASLRRLLCHSSTEKTSKVLKQAGIESSDNKPQPPGAPPAAKGATAGHGRGALWAGLRCVSRGAQGFSAARILEGGGPVPGLSVRQSISAARPRRVGAGQRAGAHRRDRV
jgi:hypothetical protein